VTAYINDTTPHGTLWSELHPYKWKTKGYHSQLVQLYSDLLWTKCLHNSNVVQITVFKIHICILASSKNLIMWKHFIQSKEMQEEQAACLTQLTKENEKDPWVYMLVFFKQYTISNVKEPCTHICDYLKPYCSLSTYYYRVSLKPF